MCGILGFSVLNENTRPLLEWMVVKMALRGQDGIGYMSPKGTWKKVGHPVDTWVVPEEFLKEAWGGSMVAHTRGASVGKISERNQHPFLMWDEESARVVRMVHNGCVPNHDALSKSNGDKHPRNHYEVDSEQIGWQIVLGEETWKVQGWGFVNYYLGDLVDTVKEGNKTTKITYDNMKLYVVKFNMTDAYFAQLETGEVVWASTKEAIQLATIMTGKVVAKYIDTKGDHRYRVEPNDLVEEERMVFGTRQVGTATRVSWEDDLENYRATRGVKWQPEGIQIPTEININVNSKKYSFRSGGEVFVEQEHPWHMAKDPAATNWWSSILVAFLKLRSGDKPRKCQAPQCNSFTSEHGYLCPTHWVMTFKDYMENSMHTELLNHDEVEKLCLTV